MPRRITGRGKIGRGGRNRPQGETGRPLTPPPAVPKPKTKKRPLKG